ncbi:hypothetical protein KI688_000442 [Linnemannia hyalina]|uniref:Uncharacterized protein n=1 Tax=Linnemannia hyalina TaxID=64524 RepID=A0A9P8BY42_9FUNG|nr:hypothetical protein KI688_000442 [Linnemannia hyalina]
MIDIQGSQRQSSTGKNKMVVTTLDGEEEEIEVIGSGISTSFQPASDKGQRLPPRLPNLKYNAPESSVNNYTTALRSTPTRGSQARSRRSGPRIHTVNIHTHNPFHHRTRTILMAIHPITNSIIQTTPPITLLMTVRTILIPATTKTQGIHWIRETQEIHQ